MTADNAITDGALRALLLWYRDAGVDEAVSAFPADSFRAPDPPAPDSRAIVARTVVPQRMADADQAQVSAASCTTIEALRDALERFEGCALKRTATKLVFADGDPQSDLMFIGEAPGREEDLQGLPFVGRSGQLLDRMLAAIGYDRRRAYISNVLYWRPPANRPPTNEEMAACRPFVRRHIEIVRPKVLVALGGVAAKELLDTTEGIMRLRGRWRSVRLADGTEIPLMPTFHPAYLLRQPAHKRMAWRDFLAIKQVLDGGAPSGPSFSS